MNTMQDDQQPGSEGKSAFDTARTSADSVAAMIGTKNLKIIIITMPFVFLAVVGVIIAVFAKPGDAATTHMQAAQPTAVVAGDVGGIALPGNAVIRSVDIDGNRLAMHVTTPDGAMILVYDIDRDKIIETIPVTLKD